VFIFSPPGRDDPFRIVHAVRGRTRLRLPPIRPGKEVARIETALRHLPGIRSIRVNPHAACVVVTHAADVTANEVCQHLRQCLRDTFAIAAPARPKNMPASQSSDSPGQRSLYAESLEEKMRRVGLASAVLPFFVFRRGSHRRGLLGRFLTIPGLTSLALSVHVLKSGIEVLFKTGRPNADTLTTTGIISSLVAGQDVSALAIVWLTELAELLTEYTMGRTRSAIGEMLSTGEEEVWRVAADGSEELTPLEEIHVGDQIVVHTGEKVCVDGTVAAGEAAVDQASITGEFMPLHKRVGDSVFGGTVLKAGSLTVRAERIGDDTAVARIVHLVEQASERRSPIQTYADRVATKLIPMHFAAALAVYLLTRNPTRSLTMLVIDYSCSLRLSTATALSAAIFSAARQGVLIKGGNHIESLAGSDTLLLDKTGTVTTGKARVTEVLPLAGNLDPQEVLSSAAAAEETTSHPVAKALLDEVKQRGWQIPKHSSTDVYVSRGVETSVNGHKVCVGSRQFMHERGIPTTAADDAAAKLQENDAAVIYVGRDRSLLGVVGIRDSVQQGMASALERIRQSGLTDIQLLTGDTRQHAAYVAGRIGLSEFICNMQPEDKMDIVRALREHGAVVVMVGDGSNDAPALAAADVGIVLGANRTDVAVEAADIIIAGGNPDRLPALFRLGRDTMRVIRENFAIAIGVNSAGLAMGALGWLPLFWGVVLHNCSTLVVVLNSSRLLYHDLGEAGRQA
jgi:cation-transporting P-type ATPase C